MDRDPGAIRGLPLDSEADQAVCDSALPANLDLQLSVRSGVSGERRSSLFQSGSGARQSAATPKGRFMFAEQFSKEQAASHEPARSGDVLVARDSGLRRGRRNSGPHRFMSSEHGADANAAPLEPSPRHGWRVTGEAPPEQRADGAHQSAARRLVTAERASYGTG